MKQNKLKISYFVIFTKNNPSRYSIFIIKKANDEVKWKSILYRMDITIPDSILFMITF